MMNLKNFYKIVIKKKAKWQIHLNTLPLMQGYRFTKEQKGMLLQCPAILQTENPENLLLLGAEYESGHFVQPSDIIFAESCYVKAQLLLKKVPAADEKTLTTYYYLTGN